MKASNFAFVVVVGTAGGWLGRLLWYVNATYPHDGGGAYLLGSALVALLAMAISVLAAEEAK